MAKRKHLKHSKKTKMKISRSRLRWFRNNPDKARAIAVENAKRARSRSGRKRSSLEMLSRWSRREYRERVTRNIRDSARSGNYSHHKGRKSPESRRRILRLIREGRIGGRPWNKGLTKADHPSIMSQSEKISGEKHWLFGKSVPEIIHPKFRGGLRKDLGHFVRSSWEANVARFLKAIGLVYRYEPKTFFLGYGLTYRPDFYLPEIDMWIEIIGQKRTKDVIQIGLFRKQVGYRHYIVIDGPLYRKINSEFSDSVRLWE